MKYGITWTNDEESVCQTGYVYDSIEEARQAALSCLKFGGDYLLSAGRLGSHGVDQMNDGVDVTIKYGVIQTLDEDLETVELTS